MSYNPNNALNTFLEELSTSIDYAITENKPRTLMGDYNLDYLNKKEQSLDTIMVPSGMNITNNIPTRISGNCKSLLDYIVTDYSIETKLYIRYPSRNNPGKMSDHFATSIITEIKMRKPPNVTIKENS